MTPDSLLSDRVQPNNLEAERAVLGAALLDKNALYAAVETLEAEDFYDPKHAMAFEVIKSMTAKDKAVDAVTFEEELSRENYSERLGGPSFTAMLIDAVTTAANIEHYCAIVREKAIFRALIRAGAEITRTGYAADDESNDALSTAERHIFEIARRGAQSSLKEIKKVVMEVFNQLEEPAAGAAGKSVNCGFADLDALTGGLQPGSLNIIAARPSVGKTAFALNIATHAAIAEDTPTLIFSLEMSAEQVASRMLSSIARVNIREIMNTMNFDKGQWNDITSAAGVLCGAPIYIDDSSFLSTFELQARCRRFMSKHKESKRCLVIIDYLQLMSSDLKRGDNRNQEVADISRKLKGVAREFEIPVIALSQLNRKTEERGGGKHPMLSDLRDSGAIEQDADIVAFLHRKSYQDLDSTDNTAELLIQKHRNGPTGKVDLVFYREFSRFESLTNYRM
jgi:replicative DNA helicase